MSSLRRMRRRGYFLFLKGSSRRGADALRTPALAWRAPLELPTTWLRTGGECAARSILHDAQIGALRVRKEPLTLRRSARRVRISILANNVLIIQYRKRAVHAPRIFLGFSMSVFSCMSQIPSLIILPQISTSSRSKPLNPDFYWSQALVPGSSH